MNSPALSFSESLRPSVGIHYHNVSMLSFKSRLRTDIFNVYYNALIYVALGSLLEELAKNMPARRYTRLDSRRHTVIATHSTKAHQHIMMLRHSIKARPNITPWFRQFLVHKELEALR